MPEDLRGGLASAALTILKGDLGHRRFSGDQLWEATASFADLATYFVGLEEETLGALERSGDAWRTSGTHALIQVRQQGERDHRLRGSRQQSQHRGPEIFSAVE